MPKKDQDLDGLRDRLDRGGLYCYENDTALNIWHSTKPEKFARKLRSGETVMVVGIERSKNQQCGFRVHVIRGEDIGYVLMKRYEVISCLKSLDIGTETS